MNNNSQSQNFEKVVISLSRTKEDVISNEKLKNLFNKLLIELCKKDIYNDVWKSDIFPDIPSSFKNLVEEKFWLKENRIFETFKNNFFKSPYTLKTKLKNSIKAFVKDFQWQKIKNKPNMSEGTKNFLISQKENFIYLIKKEFSEKENMKPKIIRFVKQAIIKKLEAETNKVKIEELESVRQKLNELKLDKTNIWLSEFFNIKDVLKNIFSLKNNPLSIDTFKIDSATFDDKMNKWISERLQYQKDDVYENKTFWIYKQDLIDLLRKNRSPFSHKGIISLKLAKQIFEEKLKLNKNDLDEEYWEKISQIFSGLKQGFIDFGLNFNDIKINGELSYQKDSKERGEIEIKILSKNNGKNNESFLLNEKIKFAKENSLRERIKKAWNEKIAEISKYFKKNIDEKNLKSILTDLTIEKIKNFENNKPGNENIELDWNKLKQLFLNEPGLNIEEIDYKNKIRTAKDKKENISNINFKYFIKINNDKKIVFALDYEIFFNYNNKFKNKKQNNNIFNTNKIEEVSNIEYKSLISQIIDECTKLSFWNPNFFFHYFWINQFLDENYHFSNKIIDQNKAFQKIMFQREKDKKRIPFDDIYKNSEIPKLIKDFNKYREDTFGEKHKDDFRFQRSLEFISNKNKHKPIINIKIFDMMLEENKKFTFTFNFDDLKSARKIQSGPYQNIVLGKDLIKNYLVNFKPIKKFQLLDKHLEYYYNINNMENPKKTFDKEEYIPKIGEKLDLNLFKVILKSTKYFMNVSEKMKISFRTIIDEIKNLGFENVKVSKIYLNNQKKRKGVDVIISTSYYILNSDSQKPEKATYNIFLPIEYNGVSQEYIENKKQKTIKKINENWPSDKPRLIKGKITKKGDIYKFVDFAYSLFKEKNDNYRLDIPQQVFDNYTNKLLLVIQNMIDPDKNMEKLKKLFGDKIPSNVLEMLKDKGTREILSRLLNLKGWNKNKKLAQKIKDLLQNKKLFDVLKKSPNNIQKMFTDSFKMIEKIDKNIKYVYFGSGIAFSLTSAVLSSVCISKIRIAKKSQKLNLNLKSSKLVIIASSATAVLSMAGSIIMNIIFFGSQGGF